MKLFTSVFLSALFVGASAFATEPSVVTGISQKNDAVALFLADQKVHAALTDLKKQGYQELSVDALPYNFFYTDEGPASFVLVSASLGKAEQYGWSTKYVTARVNTDRFGQRGAQLINHETLAKQIGGSK